MPDQTILTSVPSFTFYQFDDEGIERPVNVRYYNGGSITLEQDNHEITLYANTVKELMRAVVKNLPEAKQMLNKK